ncbi:MAG: alpha/beta fold hydrolase [Bacteroidota bacterium]|nr:alpha/beta fold hydrolase [Bacteroidota bacterium]
MKKISKLIIYLLLTMCIFQVNAQNVSKEITLNDIYKKGVFRENSVYGIRSMKDGEHFTTIEKGKKITRHSFKSGEAVEILFNSIEDDFNIRDYVFSADESKILLAVNAEYIYRRSFTADYYIYDIQSKEIKKVSEKGRQMFATFSPDGTKVGFVRDNNIFIKNLKTNEEQQITFDGKFNHIINGGTDWVYEEEFAFTKAFFWSPKGDKIAYYKFDESEVPVFNMTKYNSDLYPENYAYKYPKAGEKNSIVSIHVYDLNTGKTNTMDVGEEKDQYIPRIKWANENNKLVIIRENRLQNHIEILLANTDNRTSNVIYEEKNKYYIERIDDSYMTMTDDGKYFIINSEKDGWNHLYLYDINGKYINQITKGEWDVTDFIGIDSKTNTVYYQSAEESPLHRAVYSIKMDGSKKKKLSEKKGNNRAVFSNGFKYYINYYSNATTPRYITLHNKKGKLIRVLEDNEKLKQTIKEYNFTPVEFLTISTPSSQWDLNAYMIKPPDFDPEKKYPMFMYLYGGPGSQSVLDNWSRSYAWFQMLAQKGYVVVCVDNRGTGGRGEEFKKMTYGQLGKYETVDQIEAAEHLSRLPYIDENRTGIWGWSYGGFMSTSCLFLGNNVFEMAIAVAPVTSWRYYDSIYTELYMGLPQDNPNGYDDNSPLNHADKLKGKYLLIHGTADDNVHFQNAIELSEKLVQENKQFEMQFYMDKDHGIYGGNTSYHLYTRMTNFILENL